MPRPTVHQDKNQFLSALKQLEGYAGNVTLRDRLGWSEDRYWRTHGVVSDEGLIIRSRGKGGSVSLVEKEQPSPAVVRREHDIYLPAKHVIENSWVKERSFDEAIVEITASPG